MCPRPLRLLAMHAPRVQRACASINRPGAVVSVHWTAAAWTPMHSPARPQPCMATSAALLYACDPCGAEPAQLAAVPRVVR